METEVQDTNFSIPCHSKSEPPKPSTSRNIVQKTIKTKLNAKKEETEHYDLKGVVNILILLGLNSVNMWEKGIFKVRNIVSDLMNPDLTTLYFHLKLVTDTICTNIAINSDLSQEKLEMVNELNRNFDELMDHASTVVQVHSKHRYSATSVKILKELVEDIIQKLNAIEISDDEEETKKIKLNKKRSFIEEDDDDDCEELFRLFDRKNSSKKKTKSLTISQLVTIKNDSVTRECITTGETGKYLIKIEVTDCEEIKGVKPSQFWTKVWKKTVFLVDDEKDPS